MPVRQRVGNRTLGTICSLLLQARRTRSDAPYQPRATANLRSVGRAVLCAPPLANQRVQVHRNGVLSARPECSADVFCFGMTARTE